VSEKARLVGINHIALEVGDIEDDHGDPIYRADDTGVVVQITGDDLDAAFREVGQFLGMARQQSDGLVVFSEEAGGLAADLARGGDENHGCSSQTAVLPP
jgi:hypothetical protein